MFIIQTWVLPVLSNSQQEKNMHISQNIENHEIAQFSVFLQTKTDLE